MLPRWRRAHCSPLAPLSLVVLLLALAAAALASGTAGAAAKGGVPQSKARQPPQNKPRFLPDGVLVQLRPAPRTTAAAGLRAQAAAATSLGGLQLRRLVGDHVQLRVGQQPINGTVRALSFASPAAFLASSARNGQAAATASVPEDAILELQVTDGSSVEEKLKELRANPGVARAEPVYSRYIHATPNDPGYSRLWHLPNVAAPAAWDVEKIKVCVIDTGIRATHQDLKANIRGGWNRVPDAQRNVPQEGTPAYNDLSDSDGHGTHVSGIIGALGNNGMGVTGVAWEVSLYVCKFDLTDVGELDCLSLCAKAGARVINASYGGPGYSSINEDAYRKLGEKGILVMAAAGNDALNNDAQPSYPCNYNADSIISVAASDESNNLWDLSNWGPNTVHLAAPGARIISTDSPHDTAHAQSSGTSMAAPVVAGAAALLFAAKPSASGAEVKRAILSSVDKVPGLAGRVQTGGRLNIERALATLLSSRPNPNPNPTPNPNPYPKPRPNPSPRPNPTPSPSPRTTCGKVREGYDLKGGDMAPTRSGASIQDCCDMCNTIPGCAAFTFVQPASRCYFKAARGWKKRRNSKMASVVMRKVPGPSHRPGPTNPQPSPTCGRIMDGYDLFGADIANAREGASIEDCCSMCSRDVPGCGAITYVHSARLCYFKAAKGWKKKRVDGLSSVVMRKGPSPDPGRSPKPSRPTTTCGKVMEGRDLKGGDVAGGQTVSSIEECCNMCSSVAGCAAVTYVHHANLCYFKAAEGWKKKRADGLASIVMKKNT